MKPTWKFGRSAEDRKHDPYDIDLWVKIGMLLIAAAAFVAKADKQAGWFVVIVAIYLLVMALWVGLAGVGEIARVSYQWINWVLSRSAFREQAKDFSEKMKGLLADSRTDTFVRLLEEANSWSPSSKGKFINSDHVSTLRSWLDFFALRALAVRSRKSAGEWVVECDGIIYQFMRMVDNGHREIETSDVMKSRADHEKKRFIQDWNTRRDPVSRLIEDWKALRKQLYALSETPFTQAHFEHIRQFVS
jgi:hypothetical protein